MHHGSGQQNVQRQLQRAKSVSGTEQQAAINHPQSPLTTFTSAASPSAPQSPNYQIIMSRSPVTGQNMNITLQNMGQMVTGNQQITLTPLPIQNPASPGFQHATQQWRFEHAPSYLQVTSPLPQPIQPQSPTQHSPVPLQGIARPGAPTTALGVCGQSPTRFVDAGMLVRLGSPPASSHFVYQDGTGIAQITSATAGQVQLASPGAPGSIRERRLSQPHSQTGGTIHHHGPQSPVATGTALPNLGSPGHITTSNLPPQISSIIQGQLARPLFEKNAQSMVTGMGAPGTGSFTVPSSIPTSSPALISPTQGLPNQSLTPTTSVTMGMKKQTPKKLEEIAPSNPEVAHLRKQCLEHHSKKMESLKEVFKEYLIELFFLQHLQGNMMDYMAFKKKPCVPLYTYLRQNDLDLEDEEEDEEQSEQYDPSKGPPVQNAASLHTPPPQLPGRLPQGAMPMAGLPMTLSQQPQLLDSLAQAGGQLQAQVKVHAAGQLLAAVNPHAQLQAQLQQQQLQPSLHLQIQAQQQGQVMLQSGQVVSSPRRHTFTTASSHLISAAVLTKVVSRPSQTVALSRPATDGAQPVQRIASNTLPMSSMSPALATTNSVASPHTASPLRPQASTVNPGTQSKLAGTNGTSAVKLGGFGQTPGMQSSQEGSQDKQVEQESQVHQRISELRKEGQWSASRLPKLMDASRPKSHWDYLLEEMQWMAADFAQERRWKEAAAKKLVRTCARHHQEKKLSAERSKKEEEMHLRHIASTIAREVEFFWANIEQVVEIKLQFEIYDKRLKMLSLQKASGKTPAYAESTIEEQEAAEDEAEHKAELVAIDSLLSVEQYRGADKASSTGSDGKAIRDIAEVAAATEVLLPKGSSRSPAPVLLHGALREYQQIGVDWMVNLHKKHLNGILADETGLGKTVQTVAYMAQLAGQEGIWGPHLVVVRTCKLLTWEMEFKRWCPGLKILLYLGSARERRAKRTWWNEANSFHVVLTSYKLLFKDHSHFLRRSWRHLVLDEVQHIKNLTEKHWETIFSLKSEQRLLLINTPLQNTLKELWTMVHFLLPGITRRYSDFPVKAGTDQNQDYCHKLVIRLHRMIQPFILRRSKRDVEKQLPKKYEHILKCRLSSRQKSLYEDILTQPGAQEALKTGHFVSVLQVLMQLQRVCNHPALVAPREASSSYVCPSLEYSTPSLVLGALHKDPWETADLSIFDLIGNENRLTRYQTEAIPKLKISQQLIEEIHSAPDPPARPKACKIKPMRLFQPVQYGTKPEGRLVAITSTAAPRPPTTTPANTSVATTVSQPAQARGKSPVTTTASAQGRSSTARPPRAQDCHWQSAPGAPSAGALGQALAQVPRPALAPGHAVQPGSLSQRLVLTSQAQARLPSGDVVKIAQLANTAGRISQPETPVTLQFQGNKFTLSPSQLRQLTTGQPLQLQGNILQIVSAPGQQILRPQGSMVMQTVAQTPSLSNASPAAPPNPSSVAPQGEPVHMPPPHLHGPTARFTSLPCVPCGVQEMSEEKSQALKERLGRLFLANERRCGRRVLLGADLLQACTLGPEAGPAGLPPRGWRWAGRESCVRAQHTFVGTTSHLQSSMQSEEQRLEAGHSLIKRLSCVVPAAVAPPPHLYAANPPVPYSLAKKCSSRRLTEAATPHGKALQRLASRRILPCPDLQLMQMDSGKLEAMAVLLQKLRSERRRVLIFTQMPTMLDLLEAFLDHRHLPYVRVDESLTPEERQERMKRFNRNRQVFCGILTNRCCSAVGPVFDADTIIFYDADLDPSMDARTQEWCDKIGRAKDMHIYRLESGNSIEEKLLKNGTKDLIREVAAQGTDYTLAFLTQRTIQDLFEVEASAGEKVEEFVVLHQEPSPSEAISPRVARPYIQALHSITLDGTEKLLCYHVCVFVLFDPSNGRSRPQLTPIERYALHYLEYLQVGDDESLLKEKMECAKRSWEVQQLQKLKTEEEDQLFVEGEEDLFTYTREDAYNMEYVYDAEDGHTEIMPLWTPPTPPQDDNDIYIDSVMCLMYDAAPMPEAKLPPVYVRKEHKRLKMDPSAARKKKKGHGETVIPPRSLFEKASMLKVRREGKDQKKNFSLKQQAPFAKPLPSLVKPAMETGQDNPEWLISEDWALLQAVKQLLELPLNLTIVSPAHTPNWDLVSDVVNSCSRIYRSPKQCRNRYENVIIPREEGKLMYEANPKKKTKSIYKNSRPLRTCQIYTQDDNATQIQLYNSRFELMKIIASKRSPPIKPLLGMNPFQKNPKHASVLAESGISYDKPLPPIQVASQRAERIAKEKKVHCRFPVVNVMCVLPVTVGGIVNTVAGVPQSPFQANKRLPSPVISGTLSPVAGAGPQVHAQQRVTAAPAEVVAIATGQAVRAGAAVTASSVVTTTLSSAQSQTRSLVTQVTPAAGMQLPQSKPLTQAHIQMLRQQHHQAPPPQIKALTLSPLCPQDLNMKLHKQKLQLSQQGATVGVAGPQAGAQVQPSQAGAQLGPGAASRTGAVLTGTTVAGLQVARMPTQGQVQVQVGQTAQVTLTKPPVVSVPAVVSSGGVTALPVTVAGLSVAIGPAQKAGKIRVEMVFKGLNLPYLRGCLDRVENAYVSV
uniref:E1A binding protein p400 n=1 Tax=Gadus morhua TaxID=8049 RepID=A0A8C5ALH5_GADMO